MPYLIWFITYGHDIFKNDLNLFGQMIFVEILQLFRKLEFNQVLSSIVSCPYLNT